MITILSLLLVGVCVLLRIGLWILNGLFGAITERARYWAAGAFVFFSLSLVGVGVAYYLISGRELIDGWLGRNVVGLLIWHGAVLGATLAAAKLIWAVHDRIRKGA